ncbi:unnamed protein product [Trichobilharzia szidati]|nr:unnamed protein product [Trichobilharzia szidati]
MEIKRSTFFVLLTILCISINLSVEICLFITDQYVFERSLNEHGIPYATKDELENYKNLTSGNSTNLKLAQRKAALVDAAFNGVRISVGLITTLIIGYLSDRFGRKCAFALLLGGETLQIIMICIITLLKLNEWLTIVSGLFEAFCGGGLLTINAQISAAIMDASLHKGKQRRENKDRKTKKSHTDTLWTHFAIFDGMANLSMSAGNLVAGSLIYRYGFEISIATCACIFVPSLISITFLPETHKRNSSKTKQGESHSLKVALNIPERSVCEDCCLDNANSQSDNQQSKRTSEKLQICKHLDPILIMLSVIIFLTSLGAISDVQYLFVYLMGAPFLWDAQKISIYVGVVDVVGSFLSVILAYFLMKFEGKRKTVIEVKSNETEDAGQLENVTNQSNSHHKLVVLVIALSITLILLICNRFLVGIAYMFSVQTANLLVYIAILPRLMKSFIVPVLRTMFILCTASSKHGECGKYFCLVNHFRITKTFKFVKSTQ